MCTGHRVIKTAPVATALTAITVDLENPRWRDGRHLPQHLDAAGLATSPYLRYRWTDENRPGPWWPGIPTPRSPRRIRSTRGMGPPASGEGM